MLRALLSLTPPAVDSLDAWWAATRQARDAETTTADRALTGGVLADRLGFAFASGYQEALRALVPGEGVRALCVTEARGNSPKDIDTTITADGNDFVVTGAKKWATAGPLASDLLVCAKSGVDAQGRNALRMVRVSTTAPGVTITPSSAPFVPEIPHAEVKLDRVRVEASALLPGDGYADYVKPFRTVEDAHVHCALLGYLTGVARRHQFARDLIERLLAAAAATRALALADPKDPATHVALAGAITLATTLVGELESVWEDFEDDEWARWQRDRALLKVAGAARVARRDAAWSAVTGSP
ncbi:MAG TPA: acyl-CoA dehydrogenase family protein [Kofleriaceae bacterium]|jgi:alkylation response protein AidB-like acyl-CoA dehydrogenase|nr:acyl-CoA dehydrogenase family protein [Kofleriaceae bacterium]